MKKNGQRRYTYAAWGRDTSYFVKKQNHSNSYKKFFETDIKMLEFFNDNISVMFGTNRAPLLDDMFLYSYEADFIQGPLKK